MTKLYAVRLEPELMAQARSLGYTSDSEVLRAGLRVLLGLPANEVNTDIQALTDRVQELTTRLTSVEQEVNSLKKHSPDRSYRVA